MERSAFDALFTTDRLQILKVLLPCLPPDKQGGLAVYIKMQELFRTLDIVRHQPRLLRDALGPVPDGDTFLEQIFPFCSSSQQEQIRQLRQMSRQMDSMREMMETVQMMQSLFPEGMNPEDMDISQIMNMFSAAGMDSAAGGASSSPADTDDPAGGASSSQGPGSTEDDSTKTPMPDARSSSSSSPADADGPANRAAFGQDPGQSNDGRNPPEQIPGSASSGLSTGSMNNGGNSFGQIPGSSNPLGTPYTVQGNWEQTPSPTPDISQEMPQEQVPVTFFPSIDPRDERARDSEGIPFPAWRTDVQAAAKDMP